MLGMDHLISQILSDNAARLPAFGWNNRLEFADLRVAVKTDTSGTDADHEADGWTIGYTPQLADAVWVGNTDNSPVAAGASGYQMAAPIWRSYMDRVLPGLPPADFPRSDNIVQMENCADSGARPAPECPADRRKMELFAGDQPPWGPELDFYRRIWIDLWTGLQANEHCPEALEEAVYVVIEDPAGRKWVEETAVGRQWAADRGIQLETVPGDPSPRLRQPPTAACGPGMARPAVLLTAPTEGQTVAGILTL